MHTNHLNIGLKKSLCKTTQRRKCPDFLLTLQSLLSPKGIRKQHLSREKNKWSKPPLWEDKGYIYFLVTKVDYDDFFLRWSRCLNWDRKYGIKQHTQKSNMNWASKKKNDLIGPVTFSCQRKGSIITTGAVRQFLGVKE